MRSDELHAGVGGSGTRVAVLHVRNRLTHATRTSEPLAVYRDNNSHHPDAKQASHERSRGILIGRDACQLDPLVAVAHGTLECTPQHGVWVYVDHSEHGTTLNQKLRVHRDAAIVRDGDVLSLGNTEITLTFQVQSSPRPPSSHDDHSNNNNPISTTMLSPSPPPTPLLPSQLARQMLPNIETTSRLQQPPPEYINSPIPGTNWRKKRHSISHVARKPLSLGEHHASISASQTFTRTKPLVPSAPSTPPQKDAPPAVRHVSHHVATHSPQSAYYHVKFKDEPETMSTPESIPEDTALSMQHPRNQQQHGEDLDAVGLAPSPPLEYSSSPVTIASGKSFLSRLQHSPSSAPTNVYAPKPSPPSAPAVAAPFSHAHHFEMASPLLSPAPALAPAPTRASNRPMDLRIQVAKRNAGLAAARPFSGGGATTTPTAASASAMPASSTATRPAALSRGITIPTTTTSAVGPQAKPTSQRRLDFTPPASPVAHQDILRQNQSLLNILKNKYKEEQKLKREQAEWMRSQFPSTVASSPSGSVTVPSMSPIRHDKEASLDGDDDDDDDLIMPTKAPALLRTVSLGQTNPVAAHMYHQPSPRLTQAVLASRARKGSFDGGRHHHHPISAAAAAVLSPRAAASLALSMSQQRTRVRSSSGGSSVASSVSTEPANHRRVLRSLSFSSSRAESSGELSDFLGYDDDDADDGLLSFTTYYGDGGLDDTIHAATITSQRSTPRRRSRLPSLDDDMAGVLNSPSHASTSFGRHSAFASSSSSSTSTTTKEPRSVAKPRARSADVRRADQPSRARRMHQLGIDLERSPTHA